MQEQLVGKGFVVSAIKYSNFKGLINSLLIPFHAGLVTQTEIGNIWLLFLVYILKVSLKKVQWPKIDTHLLGARSCKLVNAAKLFRTVRRLASTWNRQKGFSLQCPHRWEWFISTPLCWNKKERTLQINCKRFPGLVCLKSLTIV